MNLPNSPLETPAFISSLHWCKANTSYLYFYIKMLLAKMMTREAKKDHLNTSSYTNEWTTTIFVIVGIILKPY